MTELLKPLNIWATCQLLFKQVKERLFPRIVSTDEKKINANVETEI